MKILRFLMVALTFGAFASAAQARDSFNIGISLGSYGGHGYYGAPAITYHAVPQVIYYDAPRVLPCAACLLPRAFDWLS